MKLDPATRRENASLTRRLLVMVAGSFAFGFALVPLYDVICEAAGIRVNDAPSRLAETAGTDRRVALEFVSIVAPGGEWELVPQTKELSVQPGRLQEARFVIRSRAAVPVTGQAVPSVAPSFTAIIVVTGGVPHDDVVTSRCWQRLSLVALLLLLPDVSARMLPSCSRA